MIGVGVTMRCSLGLLMGVQGVSKVLGAPPSKQDDRDIEDEGEAEATARWRKGHPGNCPGQDLAAKADEQQDCCHRRARRDEMTAGEPDGLAC